VSKEYTHMMN